METAPTPWSTLLERYGLEEDDATQRLPHLAALLRLAQGSSRYLAEASDAAPPRRALDDAQRGTLDAVLSRLGAVGWDEDDHLYARIQGGTRLKPGGAPVPLRSIELEIWFDSALVFRLRVMHQGHLTAVRWRPGQARLEHVLDVLVRHQHALSQERALPDFVRDIEPFCRSICLEVGADAIALGGES